MEEENKVSEEILPEIQSVSEIVQEEHPETILVEPEPSAPVSSLVNSHAIDSAVTVYVPYQPEGPTVTQLEKAAKAAKIELKKQRKKDKKRLRLWKKEARKKARVFLNEIRSSDTSEDKLILKKRFKAERKAWKKSIKDLDESEKILQKKSYKAFRKKLHARRRAAAWLLIAVLLASGGYVFYPVWENMSQVVKLRYETSGELAETVRDNGRAVAEQISDEGIVLLKNENNILPLKDPRINVFGLDSYQIRSGEKIYDNLCQSLDAAGISYNVELHTAYLSANTKNKNTEILGQVKTLVSGKQERKSSGTEYLTDELVENARKYSDQALVILGSDIPEGEDCSAEDLKLTAGRIALLRKLDENFKHVIVVINSANAPDLKPVDSFPSVEAILWMGEPGETGTISLGKILSGIVSPSGRLTDTWAYDASGAPAAVNVTKDPARYRYSEISRNYIQYEEGIYVGYRYYETRYQEDESGYAKAVRYPFGYGLSYTAFDWETVSFRTTPEKVIWRVKVTNIGDMAGKDVLQLYFTPPYSEGDIEKSTVELAAYEKTDLIQPGESETVTLRFDLRDMASYDQMQEAYVLRDGIYGISLRRNAHEIAETQEYAAEETTIYTEDKNTGAEIKNRFGFADGGLTYLSRSDWTGTYPKGIANAPGSATIRADIRRAENPEASSEKMPETEANNGIRLAQLKGKDYSDELWSDFLDQFSLKELYGFTPQAGWHTSEIRRFGIPSVKMLGDPDGLRSKYTSVESVSYPSEIVLAATWNNRLAEEFGKACGEEAKTYGIQIWYAPDLRLHRTVFGGDNAETYSEDPLLTGKIAAQVIKGSQSSGTAAVLKGFVSDSSTFGKKSGICTWINEQALRELYLRPYEIAVKEGKAHGVMTSGAGIGSQWCGACSELLQQLLREEWGYEGFVTTDPAGSSYKKAYAAYRNGNDLMLETGLAASKRSLKRAYRSDAAGVLSGLRESAHNYCYTIVNYTDLFE